MMERTFYGVAFVAVVVVGMGAGPNVLDGEALAVHGSVNCDVCLMGQTDCLDDTPLTCPGITGASCEKDNNRILLLCIGGGGDLSCQPTGCVNSFEDDSTIECTEPY